MKPPYRPEIDGLRAIAVSLVVLFHAFPNRIPGGFVGVDVFFVISGFLITGIIVNALDGGTFSFSGFYARRVRRIFPALIAVLATVAIAALTIQSTAQLELLGKHGLGAVLFVPNIVFWQEAGYFDVSAETKLLLHTWSLGVEEQFYIVCPAFIAIAYRFRNALLPVLAVVTVASFSYSAHLSINDPTAAFYSPLSRAWELAIGSVFAVLAPRRIVPFPTIISFVGAAAIIAAAMTFHGNMTFPAPAAILPVFGTCAILAAGSSGFINKAILSSKAFVAVGLISYPLYLWHWPVMAFARLHTPAPSNLMMLLLVAASFVLAAITYLFLERPIQRRRLTRTVPYLVAIMAGIGVSAWTTVNIDVRTIWYPDEIKRILAYTKYDYGTDGRLHRCWLTEEAGDIDFKPECGFAGVKKGTRVAIWGDSHAARLYPGLVSLVPEVAQYTVSSCPPGGNLKPYCDAMNEKTLSRLASDRADVVVLFARWSAYTTEWSSSEYSTRLKATIQSIKQLGSNVILVGSSPEFPTPLPDLLFNHWHLEGAPLPERIKGTPNDTLVAVDMEMKRLAQAEGADYVSAIDRLCNTRGCLSRASDDPTDLISWDYGHLTTSGANLLAAAVLVGRTSPTNRVIGP